MMHDSVRLAKSLRYKKIGRFGLTDRVYETLKELILDQKLLPGMNLNIDQLCRQLGVSTSPLREALARLSSQRLVRFEPFIGYFVEGVPDRNYYEELIEVRLMIECHAARQGAPRKVCSSLDAMEQAVRAMEQLQVGPRYNDYRLFNSWDTKFHQALVESAGNRVLTQAYADLHVHLHVSRLYVLLGGIDTSKAVEDHIRILTAFRDGDPDASEAAVRRHLENARRRLLVNDELTASAKSEETTER